jgi:phage tail sheath protein FI
MPELRTPGVYVHEVPTDLPIAAVPTSRTAFLGSASQGPVMEPTIVRSLSELRSTFGTSGTLHEAAELFFANGGTEAVAVRLRRPDVIASAGVVSRNLEMVRGGAAQGVGKASMARDLAASAMVPEDVISGSSILGPDGGLRALDRADFDLLCIPPYSGSKDVETEVLVAAAAYCCQRRAMLLIDPPRSWTGISDAERAIGELRRALGEHVMNAALYFPYLRSNGADVPPCAAVAGVLTRTDALRGCWKAPAGLEAEVRGVQGTSVALTDADIDRLNISGINSIRTMSGTGTAVWGSRTLAGAGSEGSEWKYLPVRRTALLIEKSLVKGLGWTAFEPNDRALWSRVRSSAETFLLDLFRRGAFRGTSPRDAFFVRCGPDTTSPYEIKNGSLNLQVGFAPLRPAEFIVLNICLTAGTGTT